MDKIPLYVKEHGNKLYMKYYDVKENKYIQTSTEAYPCSFCVEKYNGELVSTDGKRVTEKMFNSIPDYKDSLKQHKNMEIRTYNNISLAYKYRSETFELDGTLEEMINYPVDIPRVGWYDIETIIDGDIDTLNTPNPITTISFYHSVDKEWIVYGYKEDISKKKWWGDAFDIPPKLKPHLGKENAYSDDVATFIYCDDEQDLLKKFAEGLNEIDVLIGFNSEIFDDAYIVNRFKFYGMDKYLSPYGNKSSTYVKSGQWGDFNKATILGINLLDYRVMIKEYYIKLQYYSLSFVSTTILGAGKDEYDGNLNDLYRDDFEAYCKYNLVDIMRLVQAEEILHLLPLVYILSSIFYVNYEDIKSMTIAYDSIIYHELNKHVNRDRVGLIKNIDKLLREIETYPANLRFSIRFSDKRYYLTETRGGYDIDGLIDVIEFEKEKHDNKI